MINTSEVLVNLREYLAADNELTTNLLLSQAGSPRIHIGPGYPSATTTRFLVLSVLSSNTNLSDTQVDITLIGVTVAVVRQAGSSLDDRIALGSIGARLDVLLNNKKVAAGSLSRDRVAMFTYDSSIEADEDTIGNATYLVSQIRYEVHSFTTS